MTRMGLAKRARRGLQIWKQSGLRGLFRILWNRLFAESWWTKYSEEAMMLANRFDFSSSHIQASKEIHRCFPGKADIRSISWFLPDFQNPFYGGVYTILRFAAYLQETQGVRNQFVIVGIKAEKRVARLIAQAFPSLAGVSVREVDHYDEVNSLPETDAAVATLWNTAYYLLRFNSTKRKFYFLQDYEPMFYPAGSTCAQAEATYQFGFYGIANTASIKKIYEEHDGGLAGFFVPAVDTRIFHPAENRRPTSSTPYTVFFYARPEHPRNGFELGVAALRKLKKRLGDRVRIITAGASWHPIEYHLDKILENRGLLSYHETADLYRQCDVGMTMMFTRHPSYLPFELMASGCMVVSNRNAATSWFLKDGENCLLSGASVSCIAETLEEALLNEQERERITRNATKLVVDNYGDWEREIEGVYRFMCDPLAGRDATQQGRNG